ncbi:glycine cleavage system protein R [bacterium]|nr:glycine cleavage system protein R [bacterium]
MNLIATIIGPDRPGLVESLSETVSQHGGNWTESRMARLSGHFAGMVQIEIGRNAVEALTADLAALSGSGLTVSVVADDTETIDSEGLNNWTLQLVGQDRSGIVSQVSSVIAGHGLNVESLETERESAPMSGEMLFKATATLSGTDDSSLDELRQSLEAIAQDLMVEIALD